MSVYIALLRGINVGGNNMIKMADLKKALEAIGLGRVQTYIQSGNVLFESSDNEEQLRKSIEHEIQTVFGLTITVVLRSAAELEWIANNCPYSEQDELDAKELSGVESLYVSMLLEAPSQDRVEKFHTYKSDNDDYQIEGREIFFLFRERNSKLMNNIQKLGVHATTRNWKTINKLVSLARAFENE